MNSFDFNKSYIITEIPYRKRIITLILKKEKIFNKILLHNMILCGKNHNERLYLERYIKEKSRFGGDFGYCYMSYLWTNIERGFQDFDGSIKKDRVIPFSDYLIQKNIKISTIDYLKL